MKNLAHNLTANYAEHPSFQFGAESWTCDPGTLQRFSEAYYFLRTTRFYATKKLLGDVDRDCQSAMSDLFQGFRAQSQDQLETTFIDELEIQCKRLLKEELDYFRRTEQHHFINSRRLAHRQLDSLISQRFMFSALDAHAVGEMLDVITPQAIEGLKANAAQGKLTREDLSINAGPKIRQIVKILNREFARLGVLDGISTYVGRFTRVIGVACELSVPQSGWWKDSVNAESKPPQTLYAHLDESICFPKSIVYLSDVDQQSGPTSLYPAMYESLHLNPLQDIVGRVVGTVGRAPGSPLRPHYNIQYHQPMSSASFRRHFVRLPAEARFNSHLGWDIVPGSELEREFIQAETPMIGAAGTFVVFDGGKIFHRGGLIQSGHRLVLQVILSDYSPAQLLMNKVQQVLK